MTELHIEEGVLHVGVNPLHHLLLLLHHVGQLTHTHKNRSISNGSSETDAARKKIEKYCSQGKKSPTRFDRRHRKALVHNTAFKYGLC
jgi:hypothetical protein